MKEKYRDFKLKALGGTVQELGTMTQQQRDLIRGKMPNDPIVLRIRAQAREKIATESKI